MAVAALLMCSVTPAEEAGESRVVEIRSYNLKPGTRDRFHELFEREARPMLRRRNVDVVAYGPSLHDRDSYYLMRSFPSVEDRQKSEDAFLRKRRVAAGAARRRPRLYRELHDRRDTAR